MEDDYYPEEWIYLAHEEQQKWQKEYNRVWNLLLDNLLVGQGKTPDVTQSK